MQRSLLNIAMLSAIIASAFSSGLCLAKKGSVTGKAYLDPSAPRNCVFDATQNTQSGCSHQACNTAVKNAIKQLQNAQPDNVCKSKAKSRGCTYQNCT